MDPSVRRRQLIGILIVGLLFFTTSIGASSNPEIAPDAIFATETIDGSGEYLHDDYIYYPENDTVFDGRDGPDVRITTWDFDRFAGWQCEEVAINRLRQYIDTHRVDTSLLTGSGVGDGRITVYYEPDVNRTRVDRELPDRVVATISLFNQTHTCTVPVHLEPSGGGVPLDTDSEWAENR